MKIQVTVNSEGCLHMAAGLTYARTNARATQLEPIRFSLAEVIRDVHRMSASLIRKKGIHFESLLEERPSDEYMSESLAVLKDRPASPALQSWTQFLGSNKAKSILERHGL